jgi:integrase/recombinase XerD
MRAPFKMQSEFNTVLEYAETTSRPAMYRLMMLLSVKLGLRPMEIAGLESTWFRGEELRIPIGHTKRKAGRSLPVNDEILTALYDHMQGNAGRVFRNRAGDAFTANGISEAMRRLYKLAGVQGSCYSGRRTLATNMVDRNVNIAVVSAMLGHTSIATTQKYVGVTDSMLRRAMYA